MANVLAQVEHLQLRYGERYAVRDVSFDLREGEILAIIGPNGAGKTSTVECLEGLRKPTSGASPFWTAIPGKTGARYTRKWACNCRKRSIPTPSACGNCAAFLPRYTPAPRMKKNCCGACLAKRPGKW